MNFEDKGNGAYRNGVWKGERELANCKWGEELMCVYTSG